MNQMRIMSTTFILLLFTSFTSAWASSYAPGTLEDLKRLDKNTLSELYRYGTASFVPSSESPGNEIMYRGLPLPTPGNPGPSDLLSLFWGGKAFYTDALGETTLTNELFPNSPLTVKDVSASVYLADNSLTEDGQPVVLLDYSTSNMKVARALRDEIRQIAPGLYLGRAYLKNGFLKRLITGKEYSFLLWFALENP